MLLMKAAAAFLSTDSGATRTEVGLLTAMAVIFAVLAMTDFGGQLGHFFVSFKSHMADGKPL
ncbi:hypothetical protein [Limibacillus halophilus]|uniref:Flp pilus assembly pilin Flp n=1 Tax=Limibacillus halophilus TaxID=1579333 RepID=A0A839SVT3_9PROT|nr:hypothetical protein [Limibacillus halophilus]MBB3065790.1 Flp pilus assembly pilin Flp [Limibacillus halophilus]